MEQMVTMPFDDFWSWLLAHPNCILRAGTPESVLYDDEDLHWHLTKEDATTLLVQVLRGKRLLGEPLLDPEQISYVQIAPPEGPDERVFELSAPPAPPSALPRSPRFCGRRYSPMLGMPSGTSRSRRCRGRIFSATARSSAVFARWPAGPPAR